MARAFLNSACGSIAGTPRGFPGVVPGCYTLHSRNQPARVSAQHEERVERHDRTPCRPKTTKAWQRWDVSACAKTRHHPPFRRWALATRTVPRERHGLGSIKHARVASRGTRGCRDTPSHGRQQPNDHTQPNAGSPAPKTDVIHATSYHTRLTTVTTRSVAYGSND